MLFADWLVSFVAEAEGNNEHAKYDTLGLVPQWL